MRYTTVLVLIGAVLLGLCGGCSRGYSFKDSGYTVKTRIGDTVKVELQGNPSTGYAWQVVDLDTEMLRMVGLGKFSEGSDKVGGEGTYTYKFQPISTGRTEIRMVYIRPWEKNARPQKTFELGVEILPPPDGLLN